MELNTTNTSRRTIVKGAAWSVPVIAAAIAAPAAAASTDMIDVGRYLILGACPLKPGHAPVLSIVPGPTTGLPVGTTILLTLAGSVTFNSFGASGGGTGFTWTSPSSVLVDLPWGLLPSAVLNISSELSNTQEFTLTATASLPSGYLGTGAVTTVKISSTPDGCSVV